MKRPLSYIKSSRLLGLLVLLSVFLQMGIPNVHAQEPKDTYKAGEWLKFRVHYGFITGGYATIKIEDEVYEGQPVYHIKGFGETTGIIGFTFGVEDYYESWVDKETNLPYKFLRKIDEGGHTKHRVITFDQDKREAYVDDRKYNKQKTYAIQPGVQDMVSAMYYLRNTMETDELQKGDEIALTMFFDGENFPFKMRFLGRETVRTKFGKVKSLVFRPLVQSGRVFEEEESLTIWVSDDANKIPLRIKASLAVGSLKADLDAFKGLKHSFKIVVD